MKAGGNAGLFLLKSPLKSAARRGKHQSSVIFTSNPHSRNNASGMYLKYQFRCAHSRRCAELTYSSGSSLNLRTVWSNSVELTLDHVGRQCLVRPISCIPMRNTLRLAA